MSLDLKRIRALLFDVDGTLSDTDDQMVLRLAGWLRVGRFLFRRGDPKGFARWLVMRMESPGTYLFDMADRLDLDDRLRSYLARLEGRRLWKSSRLNMLVEGVPQMLSWLHSRYPLAVVSARAETPTLEFLERFQLRQYFQSVASAQTCRYTKPRPDPIYWVAGQLGVDPKDCLMIGDTTVDIRAGKAAGAQTVGVLCGFGEAEELRRAGASLIVARTPDLLEVLQGAGTFPPP